MILLYFERTNRNKLAANKIKFNCLQCFCKYRCIQDDNQPPKKQ